QLGNEEEAIAASKEILETACKKCGCGPGLHPDNGKCEFCTGHPSSNPACPGYEIEEKSYTMTYYGDRSDQYEMATFDLKWAKDDPRLENFCNMPYNTILSYKINKDGTKKFIEVEIDGKKFVSVAELKRVLILIEDPTVRRLNIKEPIDILKGLLK
ncbi:MAG: hypothetical protein V3V19_11030, partial [Cocleimonas sp.]